MATGKTAAIILAAGYASRMGQVKALLPMGEGTVIDKVVASVKKAGCSPVIVVVGHEQEQIIRHLAGQDVIIQPNPEYDKGMFSSVIYGIKALVPYRSANFFVLPVDHPMVDAKVLLNMMSVHRIAGSVVTYPVYGGAKGHPPLISYECIPTILLHDGRMGLKGALQEFNNESAFVECEDPGVLTDMDTPEDYQRNLNILNGKFQLKQLFIQGDTQIGKSYLLQHALPSGLQAAGGFYIQRRMEKGRCSGFLLRSVKEDGFKKKYSYPKEQVFLSRRGEQWKFHPEVFDGWAANLLEKEMKEAPAIILLDEIGGMELGCPRFAEMLYELLDSPISCIGVYKQQKNAMAQSASMDTGADFEKNRRQLVKYLAEHNGRILTLNEKNKEQISAHVRMFLSSKVRNEDLVLS